MVFCNIHPGVEQILGEGTISHRARKSKKSSGQDTLWQSRVDVFIRRCNEYERLVAALPKDVSIGIREYLSSFYSRLFRAMYEYGVLDKLGNYPSALTISMTGHFNDAWANHWSMLAHHAEESINLDADESYNLGIALNTGNSADLLANVCSTNGSGSPARCRNCEAKAFNGESRGSAACGIE